MRLRDLWMLVAAALLAAVVSLNAYAGDLGRSYSYADHPIVGRGHRATPHGWSCSFDHEYRWTLRVCVRIHHAAHWTPNNIIPYQGGIEWADTSVEGSYRLVDNAAHMTWVPWHVKMFLTNQSTATSEVPGETKTAEWGCNVIEPCVQSTHSLHASIKGFSYEYLAIPWGGCGDLHTYGDLAVAVWPTRWHPHHILGTAARGTMDGKVCSA